MASWGSDTALRARWLHSAWVSSHGAPAGRSTRILFRNQATALACSQGHRRPTGADNHKCRSCSCCTIPNEAGRHRFMGNSHTCSQMAARSVTHSLHELRTFFDLQPCRHRQKSHTHQHWHNQKVPRSSSISIFKFAESGRNSTRSNTGAVSSHTLFLIFDLQTCRSRLKLHTQQRWCGKKPSAPPYFRS